MGVVRENLSHYRVLEEIGSGGMGVVYRGRDERLERVVALKVLPADSFSDEAARRRFRQEALTLSRLNHPNIEIIYDVGTSDDGIDFLAMEYVPGESLEEKIDSAPLPQKDVISLGIKLADGLEAAHQRGIVHRDLKPANLRVTPEGRLKILDFGIAKHFAPNDTAPTDTGTSGLAGTLPYMAPEQIKGERVDGRTDIYAAGAVLYKMATGRRPHSMASESALIEAILNQPPPPPRQLNSRISSGLEHIILKALDKDPDRRYQSARELRVDLERLRAPIPIRPDMPRRKRLHLPMWPAAVLVLAVLVASAVWYVRWGRPAAIDSVAVLPFINANASADTEYLSDGLTDTLIDRLSRLPNLKVISRTSVFRYKGKQLDPKLVARELGVRAVLAGIVTQHGDDLSVTAELVDARDDSHLWGDHYNRKMSDILALQSGIAADIAGKLAPRISGTERKRVSRSDTEDAEAYQLYLRGRYSAEFWTPETIKKARELYQAALARDPNYAQAYAALADSYRFTDMPRGQAMELARADANKAVQLDDSLGEAHASLALVRFFGDWDWAGAEQEFKRAIQLNPGVAEIHHMYSHYLLAMGRVQESLEQSQRALELDPMSRAMNVHLGYHYLVAHEFDKAIAQYKKTIAMFPDAAESHMQIAYAYGLTGDHEQEAAEFLKHLELQHEDPKFLSELREAYQTGGIREFWRKYQWVLDQHSQQQYVPFAFRAMVYGLSGDNDQAFAALDKAYQAHESDLAELKSELGFMPLHSDPRWSELLRRMRLPE